MIYKMHKSAGDIIGFHVSGKLTDDDYRETFVPELEQAVAQWGKINLILQTPSYSRTRFQMNPAHGGIRDA